MVEVEVSRRVAAAARVGRAAWLFGNVYEAVVGVPALIADTRRPGGILSTGSPVRFYVPVLPVAVGGTSVVLIESWRKGGDRRPIAAAAAALLGAVTVSAYLIASINVPLLRGSLDADRQRSHLARWQRVNLVRLCLLVVVDRALRRVEDHGRVPMSRCMHRFLRTVSSLRNAHRRWCGGSPT